MSATRFRQRPICSPPTRRERLPEEFAEAVERRDLDDLSSVSRDSIPVLSAGRGPLASLCPRVNPPRLPACHQLILSHRKQCRCTTSAPGSKSPHRSKSRQFPFSPISDPHELQRSVPRQRRGDLR